MSGAALPADTGRTAIYLFIGYEAERRNGDFVGPGESHLDKTEWLADMAAVLARFYELDPRDYPGVGHFEATEDLGVWLYNHPDANAERFMTEVRRYLDNWTGEPFDERTEGRPTS